MATVELTPIIVLELKPQTNIPEWEKICELLRRNGYEVGQTPENPLIQVIMKEVKQ